MNRILILLFLLTSITYPQMNGDQLKQEAVKQLEAGKYGEAIDLLNRYISSNPQKPDGLNLRGLAHEKRGMYELAVYDLRTARKLAPNDREINRNLNRVTETWYKLLYNKIEGHKREIAIDPAAAINYLEIGKSYKNLGQWETAETWYDEYLTREHASPDEIIRYSEILAKNNNVKKGEPILKKYCEDFPDDHRLWSRYGYFTYWLGKKKTAIKAFENALELKPYFQEAMDGLDLANGRGYVYTITDTSYTYSRDRGMVSKKPRVEYPIDRYYRLLKKSPEDSRTRFLLVKALIKARRYEEAYKELEILSADPESKGKYDSFIADVQAKRDSLTNIRIEDYIKKIEKNPSDKKSVEQLALQYADRQDYESALSVLSAYLSKIPEKEDPELRFMYAKYATWDYRFREALEQLEILLIYYPGNTDYQLLRGQVAVWTDQDLNKADFYLGEVLKKSPDNLPALVASASLKIKQQEFAAAKTYIDKAAVLAPDDADVDAVRSNYEVNLLNYELYKTLDEARELVSKNDCAGALKKYDEYLLKVSAPSRLERIEYASIYICLEDYRKALRIYDDLLAEEYDFDIAVFRAKSYLWSGDSLRALREFTILASENPEDFDANFFHGVALASNHRFSEAEDIYDRLLEETTDSSRIKMLNDAKNWLPAGRLFGDFPTYLALSPQIGFYDDNQSYTYSTGGGRLEFGITSYLAAGASFSRINVRSADLQRNLNSLKGNLFIKFSRRLQLSVGAGSVSTKESESKTIYDGLLKYEIPDNFSAYAYFERNDGRIILYSPFIVDSSLDVNLARAGLNYKSKSGIRLYGYLSYLGISDDNEGNDFLARVGKQFYNNFSLGYEYQYLNYSTKTPLYWSPENFDSHCIWGDWDILNEKEDNFKINLGGRLGYITEGDFMIREISGDLSYKPLPYFVINGKVTAGSTFRYDTSYNYVSAIISAFWSIY